MKKTIGQAFGELRADRGLTMQEVADRCGLVLTTVSKIERDKPTRWETVHLAISAGMDIKPGQSKYKALHKLWLKHRAEKAESHAPGFGSKTLTKHAVEATRKFRILIRELNPAQTKVVLDAAQRSARRIK